MKTRAFLLAALFPVISIGSAQASVVVTDRDVTSTVDFDLFDGSGFDTSPASGQLDSDTWRVTGLSEGSSTFGGTATTGDFARGSSSSGVNTGGVYAFDVGSGNTALGIQPTGGDFTPGTFTLRVQNDTGDTASHWDLSYELYVLNDQPRSNSWDWAWSTDDVTYTSLTSYISTEADDPSPAWSNVQSPSVTGLGATVADGDFLYLRWTGDDVSGGGARDQFAIDTVSVTIVPEPGTALLAALGLIGIGLRRRRAVGGAGRTTG